MNRNDEFRELLTEWAETPPALEHTVRRARAKAGRRQALRTLAGPLGSVAAVFVLFAVLVNSSVTVARAVDGVPVLGDLAAAVRWSRSLSAAVENQYVQVIDQTRSGDGFTVKVEYVIVDRQQVNIFYSVQSSDEDHPYGAFPYRCYLEDGHGYYMAGTQRVDSELVQLVVEFRDTEIPDRLTLTMEMAREEDMGTRYEISSDQIDPPTQAITFTLEFDPACVEEGETVAIGRWVELDGQRIYVDSLEIYPSNARLHLADDPDNELVLTGLHCYLEDENGNRWGQDGLLFAGSGARDSYFASDVRIGSPYFARPDHLTLHITGASWGKRSELDGDNGHMVEIDLVNHTVRGLPEGWTYEGTREMEGYLAHLFRTPVQPDGSTEWELYTPAGTDAVRHAFFLVTTQWSVFEETVAVPVK